MLGCAEVEMVVHNFNLLTGTHFARFDHGKVETAATTRQEVLDHVVAVKTKSQFITRHARLRDHQDGRADSYLVSNAKTVLANAFGGGILAEHAPGKRRIGRLLPPAIVAFGRM